MPSGAQFMSQRDVRVVTLHHLGGWRFAVTFDNGARGVWDYARVKQRTGPMAAPLRDEAYVARAFLDHGAPTWPNGWDVSPEALYAELQLAGALTEQDMDTEDVVPF